MTRILIAGGWKWPQYEAAFADGLRANGADVHKHDWSPAFLGKIGLVQELLPFPSPAMARLNRDLLAAVDRMQPDILLCWRPTHVGPRTLQQVSRRGVLTVSYNNDDPFGARLLADAPWHHRYLWREYLRALPHFDRNFMYRAINVTEAKQAGAQHAAVMLPYFIPAQDRPIDLTEVDRQQFGCDVVFVGHFEPDGREQAIGALIDAGLKVRLWGDEYWSRDVLGRHFDALAPIRPALGDDYARALVGADICLCFLSRLNRDTYTRRCFEIPACGSVMLAERTDDLVRMFREDEEACFFSSHEEMVEKAQWLQANPALRDQIALAGLRRVWFEGHDVNSRARQFLEAVS